MTEMQLWDVVRANATHIEVINRELGELTVELSKVVISVEWIKEIITWQFGCFAIVLAGLVINIFLTKRNGKRG